MFDVLKNLQEVASLLVFFGCLMVLIGLIGGGIEVQKALIPRLTTPVRVLCVFVGFALIAVSAIDLGSGEPDAAPPAATTAVAPIGAAGPVSGPDPPDATPTIEKVATGTMMYRVCYIEPNDPDGGLNVRELPGVRWGQTRNQVLGTIPRDGREIRYLGQRAVVRGSRWYQVVYENRLSGWVSASYLCPDAGECNC